MAREREHVASAIARAQLEWRALLELVEEFTSADDARDALTQAFGFTDVQAMAVMDMQFRRVTHADRERIAMELVELRREIAELGGDQ